MLEIQDKIANSVIFHNNYRMKIFKWEHLLQTMRIIIIQLLSLKMQVLEINILGHMKGLLIATSLE
jgi:hypothetical protein